MASGEDRERVLSPQLLCLDRFNVLPASAHENLSHFDIARPLVQPPFIRLLMTLMTSSTSGFKVQ